MVQTVAVDFDRVIHTYERGWADGSIYGAFVPGVVNALTRLMQRYAVFVHTTRSPRQVAAWIEDRSGHAFECEPLPWWKPWRRFHNQQGILLVTNRKLPAVAYIDDRAVRFQDWDQALAEVLGDSAAAPITEDRCPAAYDHNPHDLDSEGCAVCGWTPQPGDGLGA